MTGQCENCWNVFLNFNNNSALLTSAWAEWPCNDILSSLGQEAQSLCKQIRSRIKNRTRKSTFPERRCHLHSKNIKFIWFRHWLLLFSRHRKNTECLLNEFFSDRLNYTAVKLLRYVDMMPLNFIVLQSRISSFLICIWTSSCFYFGVSFSSTELFYSRDF